MCWWPLLLVTTPIRLSKVGVRVKIIQLKKVYLGKIRSDE